ncbi:MAG: cyclase family protein, partial [Bdellovibrionales bacterium]|nr:cyclase family protein [Bdellovibrionales bacterium]
ITLSHITSTLHLGAHTDAENHYAPSASGIEEKALKNYLGLCQVISVNLPRGTAIASEALTDIPIKAPRVLFRTGSFPDPNCWNGDFNFISPDVIESFAKKNVILVGIDTPSIDAAHSKELPAHQAIHKNKMSILEGIVLSDVPDGLYQLVALPLPIVGADASPVRAVLLKFN